MPRLSGVLQEEAGRRRKMVVPGPMQQKRRGGQREGVKAEGGSKRGMDAGDSREPADPNQTPRPRAAA